MVADFFPERGRAEGRGDIFLADGLDDRGGIESGGALGVDLGNDGGQAQCGVEQREDRQQRQIDLAGTNVVGGADEADLGVEVTVFVDDAFGGSRGTRSKKNSRKIGGAAVNERSRRGRKSRTGKRETRRKGTAGGHANFHRGKRSPADVAKEARERQADKRAGTRTLDAGEEIFEPHAGINDDRNGTD